MFRDSWTVLTERNTALAEDVLSRDDEVDRLCWLIDKQYHSMLRDLGYAEKLEVGLEECLQFLTVAKLLERIGDHAVRISGTVLGGSPAVRPELTSALSPVMEISLEMLTKSVDAMFQGDLAKAEVVAGMRSALSEKYESAMERVVKLESRAAVAYTYILDSMRRTGLYATDISENAINHIAGLDSAE